MNQPGITVDIHGNRYAAVHVEELDEWAWLLTHLEDWLAHAQPETVADFEDFTGPCGARLDQVISALGHRVLRMRHLAEGRP